jgi:hypothetical protein
MTFQDLKKGIEIGREVTLRKGKGRGSKSNSAKNTLQWSGHYYTAMLSSLLIIIPRSKTAGS